MKEIMEKRGKRKLQPLNSIAAGAPRKAPKDNIDLDMMDAERLGYGCQYGRYKADHPYTKEANEARLHKKRPKQSYPCTPRNEYEKVCPSCGEVFRTPWRLRIYCCDKCKQDKDNARHRQARKKKQEENKND